MAELRKQWRVVLPQEPDIEFYDRESALNVAEARRTEYRAIKDTRYRAFRR